MRNFSDDDERERSPLSMRAEAWLIGVLTVAALGWGLLALFV